MRIPVIHALSPPPAVASPSPVPNNDSRRGPPFGNRPVVLLEVSDSDEDDPDFVPSQPNNPATRQLPARISSSPEVEFVGERLVQPNPGIYHASRRSNVTAQAAQQPPGDRETIGEMFLRGTQFMLHTLNPATFIGNRPFNHQGMPIDPAIEPADNFDDLRFDYQQPAFEMGSRESQTPQTTSEPYKAPSSAGDGFTRDLDEDEILVCPHCGDELAAGDGEVKQQVWVIKQCGHVCPCYASSTRR
jgi:hypothetical protein